VLDNYNITDADDVRTGMRLQDAYFAEQAVSAPDHAARKLPKAENEL
jgi:hypothetical protein